MPSAPIFQKLHPCLQGRFFFKSAASINCSASNILPSESNESCTDSQTASLQMRHVLPNKDLGFPYVHLVLLSCSFRNLMQLFIGDWWQPRESHSQAPLMQAQLNCAGTETLPFIYTVMEC
jgi:hypothetical protein